MSRSIDGVFLASEADQLTKIALSIEHRNLWPCEDSAPLEWNKWSTRKTGPSRQPIEPQCVIPTRSHGFVTILTCTPFYYEKRPLRAKMAQGRSRPLVRDPTVWRACAFGNGGPGRGSIPISGAALEAANGFQAVLGIRCTVFLTAYRLSERLFPVTLGSIGNRDDENSLFRLRPRFNIEIIPYREDPATTRNWFHACEANRLQYNHSEESCKLDSFWGGGIR